MSNIESDFSLNSMQLQIKQDFAAELLHRAMADRNLMLVLGLIEAYQEMRDEYHLEALIEEGVRWLEKQLDSMIE